MKMKNLARRASGLLALTAAAGVLAGCEHGAGPTASDPLVELGPGIHPVVVLAGKAGDTVRVELRLQQVQTTAKVSSYQGELGYDEDRLTLAGAETPQDLMVAWNEVAAGRVRFAGVGTDGMGDAPMLVVRFIPRGAVGAELFKLRMEEVVVEAEGFQDATAQVVAREQTLFSSVPLPATSSRER